MRSEQSERSGKRGTKARARREGGELKGTRPSGVINGGAGICTRVRKYILAGIYGAYPLLLSRFRRREAANNRRKPAPDCLIAGVRDHAPATSLLE